MTGVSKSILEGLNVIRQVCRNVKRWRDAKMALRWTAAGMLEAALLKHRQHGAAGVDQTTEAA